MLRSDAQDLDISDSRLDTISDDVVPQIEKELVGRPKDMVALVFLLYRIPKIALRKLIVYQRLSKDIMATNLHLLQDWVWDAKVKNNNWKHEFVEALLICQLFGVIKKLGLHVPSLIKYYQPDNICFTKYINPLKKALYKACGNIDLENSLILRDIIGGCFNIDVFRYESYELILLKLMSDKFITVDEFSCNKKAGTRECNVDELLYVFEMLPGLDVLTSEIKELQTKLNNQTYPIASNSHSKYVESNVAISQMEASDFDEVCELLLDVLDENDFESNIQTRIDDAHAINNNITHNINNQINDSYKIKNKDRLGVFLMFNMEYFCLPQSRIHESNPKTRHGSSFDKVSLIETMSSLNFEVITADNLDHKKMIEKMQDTIKYKVLDTDSIFMMCIMSHGGKGFISAADCVNVNIDTILTILDSDRLRGMPKVLIIQACQMEEESKSKLVLESPITYYHLKNIDFLIFWATTPGYQAYRDIEKGSIFIQDLCTIIKHHSKEKHVLDLFTDVNEKVMNSCKNYEVTQVSIFAVTLTKRLYLYCPE